MRYSRIFATLLVLAPVGRTAGAQPIFTLEQILSAPFPTELTASPDGKRVVWLSNDRGRRNVWAAEAPQFRARQITNFAADDGQELSQLTWSADSETLVFVRGEGRNSAGEIPNPTHDAAGTEQAIWAVAFSGGLPRRLGQGTSPAVSSTGQASFVYDGQIWAAPLSGSAPAAQFFRARGRNSNPAWSPDGRRLAFVSDRDDHSFVALYQPASNTIRYIAPGVDRDHTPRWSPDGRQIAFIRQPGRGGDPPPPGADNVPVPWSIWVADADTLRARQVWSGAPSAEGSLPRMAGENVLQWGADRRLVFASESEGWLRLYTLPAEGGTPQLLTPGPCEVEHVAFSSDRRTLVYSSNCGDIDRRHLWRVSTSGGTATQLTRGDTIEWNPALVADGSVAFLRSDARVPASPFLTDASGREVRAIAPETLPKDFPAAALVVPQQVVFRSADGVEIHGQLFVPPRAGGRLPAVVYMHGGPVRQMLLGWHYMYYYHNCYAMNQYLASRGYAVLSVNYRSGIGDGRAFREAPGRGPRGAFEYQDIVAAARYLRARDDVDASRIGLWGGSYGGYLTALGLARNSDLFAAGVDLHGVHDWSTRRFRSWAGTESPEVVKKARDSSPVAAVETWKSPVLFVHGDDDRNVDFSQTVDLAARLRARGVDFEQLVFPDEVHDFLLHRNWLEIYKAAADFFDRRLMRRTGAPSSAGTSSPRASAGREALASWRESIDRVDARIVELLRERVGYAVEIGRIKRDLELPVSDPARQDQVLRGASGRAATPLDAEAARRIFERIIEETSRIEAARAAP
jgi:dipeptidyl aminopeptidase/acylaminoacyl peptidase/chorismate mutase